MGLRFAELLIGIRLQEGKEQDGMKENNSVCGGSGSAGCSSLVTSVRKNFLNRHCHTLNSQEIGFESGDLEVAWEVLWRIRNEGNRIGQKLNYVTQLQERLSQAYIQLWYGDSSPEMSLP